MPPWMFRCGFGRVCFLVKFTRSTTAVPLTGFTRSTLPCLPRSLPARTTTLSPFFTCGLDAGCSFCFVAFPYMDMFVTSDDFRRERDDLHELPLAELAGHRTENARPDRLAGIVDENGRVVVELDVRPVATAALLHRANDDGLDDRTLLHGAVRRSFLHRSGDDVAEPRITAGGRSAQHLDAGDLLRTRVVRNLQNRPHLDHGSLAFHITVRTFQRFRFDSGRVSSITTRSPTLTSLF